MLELNFKIKSQYIFYEWGPGAFISDVSAVLLLLLVNDHDSI